MVLERFFDRLRNGYERSLTWVLKHRFVTLMISILLLPVTFALFYIIPKGFLPTEDTGQIFAITEAQQGISFADMRKHQLEMADIIAQDQNVEAFMSSIGAGGPNAAANSGRIFMRLKPRSERKLSADQIIQDLRRKTAGVIGIRMFMQNLPPIRIGGVLTKSQYQYTLQGPDTDELYKVAPILEAKLRALPQLQDVNTDLLIKNPQVNLEIDRDKAAALGVTAQQIESALSAAYSSQQISTILAPTNQYQVIMELEPRYQADPVFVDHAVYPLFVREIGAAQCRYQADRGHGSASHQPSRTAPRGDPFV